MPIFDRAIFDGISPPSFMFDTGTVIAGAIKDVQQAQIHGTQSSGAIHSNQGAGGLHDKQSGGSIHDTDPSGGSVHDTESSAGIS